MSFRIRIKEVETVKLDVSYSLNPYVSVTVIGLFIALFSYWRDSTIFIIIGCSLAAIGFILSAIQFFAYRHKQNGGRVMKKLLPLWILIAINAPFLILFVRDILSGYEGNYGFAFAFLLYLGFFDVIFLLVWMIFQSIQSKKRW